MRTRARGRSVTIDTTIDVDIDDLEDAGWHHEDDCPGVAPTPAMDAFDDLHRQAGHGEFPVYVCTREPCRSVMAGYVTSRLRAS